MSAETQVQDDVQSPRIPTTGYLSFTLHAHLPYVVNHGTWPHGLEWLHEAAAETYLPLLRMFGRLERDGISLHCNLNLSPILLEQLAHPVFHAEFPAYVERKINAAREDESFFQSIGDVGYARTARFWQDFYQQSLDQFRYLEGDIISSFRYFAEKGFLDVITCGATHGYMPLLGTDESMRAQVRAGVGTHERHLGQKPRGIWIPECGYRPAGNWSYPVREEDGSELGPPSDRIGVEQALSESGLEFFFVDTHLIEDSFAVNSPYGAHAERAARPLAATERTLYQSYAVEGPYRRSEAGLSDAVCVFPRDPHTGLQVWSGESGYPGDGHYLDFHKKRWPGGHRYWRVTGHNVDMGEKLPYDADAAQGRIHEHSSHFLSLVREALAGTRDAANPPILSAPFDAELFGHWWFEGVLWLEAVAREMHREPRGLELISAAGYKQRHGPAAAIKMREGSWGAGGDNSVWLNDQTAWTWRKIYEAEIALRNVCSQPLWSKSELGSRIVRQMCREVLLLESSDWQFLMTTGAACDYAEHRFRTHDDSFHALMSAWKEFSATGALSEEHAARLSEIEQRDSIFAEIDPAFWARGAHADAAANIRDNTPGPATAAS